MAAQKAIAQRGRSERETAEAPGSGGVLPSIEFSTPPSTATQSYPSMPAGNRREPEIWALPVGAAIGRRARSPEDGYRRTRKRAGRGARSEALPDLVFSGDAVRG